MEKLSRRQLFKGSAGGALTLGVLGALEPHLRLRTTMGSSSTSTEICRALGQLRPP